LKSVTGVITSLVALLGAAGTLYVTLAGAGGGETNGSSPSITPASAAAPSPQASEETTLADWRRAMNQICQDAARQIRATAGGSPTSPEEAFVFLQQVLPIASRATVEMAGLDAPPDRAEKFTALVDAFEQRDSFAEEAIFAGQRGDAGAFQRALLDVDRMDTKGSRLAAELGAADCAVDPFG
jgi:hypothetical protein